MMFFNVFSHTWFLIFFQLFVSVFCCFLTPRLLKYACIYNRNQQFQVFEKDPFFNGFWPYCGRPKVIQNDDLFETWKTWKKHGRRSKSETWGCPKVDKKRVEQKQKNKKIQAPEKTSKWRGPGGHNHHQLTLVWPQGSLGTDNFKIFQDMKTQDSLSHDASGLKPGEFDCFCLCLFILIVDCWSWPVNGWLLICDYRYRYIGYIGIGKLAYRSRGI